MEQNITQPHRAKVKAKRLQIGDARAIRAHARGGKDARLDTHKRKVHKKKKNTTCFRSFTSCFFSKQWGVFPSQC